MTFEPQLGQMAVVRTEGWAARGIRIVTDSPVNHAFGYVGDGYVVEAQPARARRVTWANRYPHAIWLPPTLEQGKGEAVAAELVKLIGTPYSWIDCACIGLAKTCELGVPESVRLRLGDQGHMMCSQLQDEAHHRAHVDLYADDRLPGDVSPGDLLLLGMNTGGGLHVG